LIQTLPLLLFVFFFLSLCLSATFFWPGQFCRARVELAKRKVVCINLCIVLAFISKNQPFAFKASAFMVNLITQN